MTLCAVDSLLAKRVFDPDDIARRFVAWLQSNPPDVGNHTRTVLNAIARGVGWEEASTTTQAANPDNAPNGSLMRCSPLALFFYRHPDYVATLSPVFSRITHAHTDCEQSCVFLNVAIALLLMGTSKQAAIAGAEQACAGASDALKARIRRAQETRNETSPTGYVLDTLEVAVWAFLHTPTLEAALIAVVNRGADADTVGAVTGALAGAHYGYSTIPARWLGRAARTGRASCPRRRPCWKLRRMRRCSGVRCSVFGEYMTAYKAVQTRSDCQPNTEHLNTNERTLNS